MSSSKNTHLANGWEAFSYFCCSAWNDSYLIDISKANVAGNLSTQHSQFVPVTQIYTTIDNLMSRNRLYSVFEYPMAPDISSSLHNYTAGIPNGNPSATLEQDLSKNITGFNAAKIKLNTVVSGTVLKPSFQRIDSSFNKIGQGVKCKPKMSDCIKVKLGNLDQYSLAVTPTRLPYFGQNQGNIVANTKPQRVIYLISAERELEEGALVSDTYDPSGSVVQMKIVSDPFQLSDGDCILIQPDIDMEEGEELLSKEFGDVTVSYSYNWNVFGDDTRYPGFTTEDGTQPRRPLTQGGGAGSKYLAISCVPNESTRDKRENVDRLTDEFYGISPTGDKNLSFGYVSYQSLGGKTGTEDNIKANASSGYPYPRSKDITNRTPSVFDNNWFDNWVTSYGALADAMQGKSSGGSFNFSSKLNANGPLGFAKLVNQTAVVNTNFLKKLLYIKKNTYHKDASDNVNIYITVVEDWITPTNALDSFGATGSVRGAAYIPYLDANASRQIVPPDYDIYDNGDVSNNALSNSVYSTKTYTDGTATSAVSSQHTMMPHQGLNSITNFPKWGQADLLDDTSYEPNKDMLLFDWRAKSLAQPTFACCGLDLICELGLESDVVRIDDYAASFISNDFTYKEQNADYMLDANSENIYEVQGLFESYVADKGTYVHAMTKVFKDSFLRTDTKSDYKGKKLFSKFEAQKTIFKNDTTEDIMGDGTRIISKRTTKIPWFTWEGLQLPVGASTLRRTDSIRCILTKKAVTALVSIIRTASLLITGMVMNHELEFGNNKVIDTITNKTLYIAWYNTKQFLKQLSELPLSYTLNPSITEDFANSTISMPSWLSILSNSSNPKIAQFFRSKLCNSRQLKHIVGPTAIFDVSGSAADGDPSRNYPPANGWRKKGGTVKDINGVTTSIKTMYKVTNIEGNSFQYYDVSWNSRNQIKYPAKVGSTFAEDMFKFGAAAADDNSILRGFVRPIMWDPSGTYPNHGLIPATIRGTKLGAKWQDLAYISSQGTLRNNGNCLQKIALNYVPKDENQDPADLTARLMYCTPYIPVGQLRINTPSAAYSSSNYATKDLYRHQDVSGDELFASSAGLTQDKAYELSHTSHHLGNTTFDISMSTLYYNKTVDDISFCGPPLIDDSDANKSATMVQTTFSSGVIPKGIGYNDGSNNSPDRATNGDIDDVIIDLARNSRRLYLHTITKGLGGQSLYDSNNNMGIGPLTWSDLHKKLVDTGDGYHRDSLNGEGNNDLYITDSLYRTQSVISLLLSGYGLYSDKVYDVSANGEVEGKHSKIYSSIGKAGALSTVRTSPVFSATVDISRSDLYEFSGGRKRFLSGKDGDHVCVNCDLLNLRLNNGDEITPKNNVESAYRWIGPSSHFLMEPNTEDIYQYIIGDKPLESRKHVIGRNQYQSRSESFASGGVGILMSAKTYLSNGIADGTDLSSNDSNYFSAIGSAVENNDFNENRPSLFALARGYDISRNGETKALSCKSLTIDQINCDFKVATTNNYSGNSVAVGGKTQGVLVYKYSDGTDLSGSVKDLVESKKLEIKRFSAAMEKVVTNLCKIYPASDRAPLHLTDHHYKTLAADESLSAAKNVSAPYNNSRYLRFREDMVDYQKNENTLLDLTGLKEAQSEKKTGGALVEAMYYIDDLSSSTIRIFYPTPLREDFVRPDKSNGMVAVACYVADTCKGSRYQNEITGLAIADGLSPADSLIDATLRDNSFNEAIKADSRDPSGIIQHFIYGRGGIITKKRASIFELLESLPNWDPKSIPRNGIGGPGPQQRVALKDTLGGKMLKAFINDPWNCSTGANTDTQASAIARTNHSDLFSDSTGGKRAFGLNPDINKNISLNASAAEINAVRYSNMSVLTITGVRDFGFVTNSFENGQSADKFAQAHQIKMIDSTNDPFIYKKKTVISRIGSLLLPGTNKKTKYVVANHENDRNALSKSILTNLEFGNIDDNETKNYAGKGQKFKIELDASFNAYYLEAKNVPGFMASHWNTISPCICAPSMSSRETGIYDPEISPGQKFRANFGVLTKQRTRGVAGGDIGSSATGTLAPVEYTVKLFTIKSPGDLAYYNSSPTMDPSSVYHGVKRDGNFETKLLKDVSFNLILRSACLEETEIMNYYKLNTILFLDEGGAGTNYKQVNKFIKNMPENLSQYLGYMNRTVTAFMHDYPSRGFGQLGSSRYWCDTSSVKLKQKLYPGGPDASMNAQYNPNQLYFENNLINIKSMQDDFDKQLMAWNEGIVGAKIGDMQLDDFDNISAEQVVDTSETLTEVPGFHILMWCERRKIGTDGSITEKTVITPDLINDKYILSSGRNGRQLGLYDGINFSLYEQDLLVRKGALSIQNEQVINNRNPVVTAIASRGSISPPKKYEYGVYKENMYLSMYKNSLATQINIPIVNELEEIMHPDSIGLNTSHCVLDKDGIKKSLGILVFQHANVLYENHNGITFSIPSTLKAIPEALKTPLIDGEELAFCMVAVSENNNQIPTPGMKTGVNPANSSLLNIIASDYNINDTSANQWGMCYDDIVILSKNAAILNTDGTTKVKPSTSSEFENSVSFTDVSGNDNIKKVDRDIQYNMMIDLFRSKNTTKVRPIMTFNKLPRIEQVKRALHINCIGLNGATPSYPAKNYAPFLGNGVNFANNFMVVSRLKYHVTKDKNLQDPSGITGGAGFYYGASGDPLRTGADIEIATTDRESLMDLFFSEHIIDASSNMYTITKLDPARKVKTQEMNGANAYTGGNYRNTALEEVPFYADTSANQQDSDGKCDISGNILHHYRRLDSKKTGITGLWIETLIYFTSLLTRPLLDGADNLTNAFWKVRDIRAGEWTRMPSELKDKNKHLREKMRSYRKCLVSTLISSMPDTRGRFITNVLNRRPPAAWREKGKVYNAFPQLEFCATFRNQLIDKSYRDSNGNKQLIKNLAKFPLYVYLDDNNQNIVFPSWKEEGNTVDGQRKMVYEEKINYSFALDYFGDEFIRDLLDPVIGFGFIKSTPFKRVEEFHERLLKAGSKFVNLVKDRTTVGAQSILENVFGAGGKLVKIKDNKPRTLGGDSGYIKNTGVIQLWTPLLEILFELAQRESTKNPLTNALSSITIQPDIIIGSHVNTFKNKFDIQNFQLKLNTVRLDINLLKECTAFEIKEVEFADNTLLTLDTINPVGNPQTLFLPIMIKTKAEKIETVKARKVTIKTDYLLETLNKMDVMSLMNNIWYRIDEAGNRIVLSPTEVARVPLFRNNPGILISNDYEPILKQKLTKTTNVEEMVLKTLKHTDGGVVRGVDPYVTNLYDDRTWSGMGWCLKGMGERLGFTGGHLDISGRSQQLAVAANDNVLGTKDIYTTNTYGSWFIEQFGMLANKTKGFDASGSSLWSTSPNSNGRGARASGVWGAHRQHLHPTQNTGGFVRSAWLAERLSTIVFGKQNFPSFNRNTEESGNIPYNDKMGSGTGGVVTANYPKSHHMKSKPIMSIIADNQFGRLKLSNVQQDDSARGQLRDYRYPGIRFDYDANVPIFAESVPNTNGTFACQIIRMIKSGLVGRPEDDKILISEQNIADQINGGVYMAFDASSNGVAKLPHPVHTSIWSHLASDFTTAAGVAGTPGATVHTNSPFLQVVMNPQQFMYLKLQEKKAVDLKKPYKGGFVAMQYVLQQLLSNDPQRFILNEKEADRHSDFTQKGSHKYNKAYKQWRVSTMDSGKPTDEKLLNADPINVVSDSTTKSVVSKPIALECLPALGRDKNWDVPSIAQKQEPKSAHPLALCIRGLDLDHCVMTALDLSNNTLTAAAIDVSGEFLKGRSSDTAKEGIDDLGNDVNNDAFVAGHSRGGANVNNGLIAKYGPTLHLTEGNAPMQLSGTQLGRHKGLRSNSTLSCAHSTYWGNEEGLMKASADTTSGIAGWNSYIEHTDLCKTYPIYMLPLMSTDTLSIIVTNDGSLKDPIESIAGAEKNFAEVLKDITNEIKGWAHDGFKTTFDQSKNKLNINNTQGMGDVPGNDKDVEDPDGIMPDTIESVAFDSFPSITGHGINTDISDIDVPSTKRGLYYDCANILVAPELGPYEKLKVLEWRSKNYTVNADGTAITDKTDPNYGKGSVLVTDPSYNVAIVHNGISIQKDYSGLNIRGQKANVVYGDSDTSGLWGSPGGGVNCNNSLEAYYAYLGMNNKINPGGAKGNVIQSAGHHQDNPTWTSRAAYLAHTLSAESIDTYYQKFITRSFTIKYKLNNEGGHHKEYNDIRISQLSSDQVTAFEVKDDKRLPLKDIFDPNNELRYEYENYKLFWDEATATTTSQKAQNDVDQMMVAKPIQINANFTENLKSQGSVLIPRRFDGRPMDPDVPSQNIVCIRKDNMIIIDKVSGKEILNPTQKDIATAGGGTTPNMRFSLDIGLPTQGGGLIRCKIPLEAASEDSHAFFMDPEYNRDYLVFKIRDWLGNKKTSGGSFPTITKQKILHNLHDALQRSQVAQLNERLLEPYTAAIASRYQPPPNTSFRMPVLLPSKPGGANIKIDGVEQPRTFFQPLNLMLNPVAGGEDHFEIRPINYSYYIRISADNHNWTNYMSQARKSIGRAHFKLVNTPKNVTTGLDRFPTLLKGSLIRQHENAVGGVGDNVARVEKDYFAKVKFTLTANINNTAGTTLGTWAKGDEVTHGALDQKIGIITTTKSTILTSDALCEITLEPGISVSAIVNMVAQSGPLVIRIKKAGQASAVTQLYNVGALSATTDTETLVLMDMSGNAFIDGTNDAPGKFSYYVGRKSSDISGTEFSNTYSDFQALAIGSAQNLGTGVSATRVEVDGTTQMQNPPATVAPALGSHPHFKNYGWY